MKKLLLLILPLLVSCLTFSMSLSAETLKTDNPNRYLKNYVCLSDGWAEFNAINKTDNKWKGIRFTIYDSDGDPVDNFRWMLYVAANSGKKMTEGNSKSISCKKLIGVKYRVQTW